MIKMENKKIRNLRKRLERTENDLTEANQEIKWFYEMQVYDAKNKLENAIIGDKKYRVGINIKKIKRLQDQVKTLQKETVELLHPSGYGSDYTAMREYRENILDQKYSHYELKEILYGEN